MRKQDETPNIGGRPPHFDSPQQMQERIDEYFDDIQGLGMHVNENGDVHWERDPKPATITGLALYLGFESRQSFYDYEKKEGFSYTIKRARLRVEHEYEIAGHTSRTPTFQIFALKNLGWTDRQEIEQTVTTKEIPPAQWNFIDAKKKSKK